MGRITEVLQEGGIWPLAALFTTLVKSGAQISGCEMNRSAGIPSGPGALLLDSREIALATSSRSKTKGFVAVVRGRICARNRTRFINVFKMGNPFIWGDMRTHYISVRRVKKITYLINYFPKGCAIPGATSFQKIIPRLHLKISFPLF